MHSGGVWGKGGAGATCSRSLRRRGMSQDLQAKTLRRHRRHIQTAPRTRPGPAADTFTYASAQLHGTGRITSLLPLPQSVAADRSYTFLSLANSLPPYLGDRTHKMYCLRHFLLVLLMPTTGASPHFLALFLLSMFILHKPCVYCSFILIALFASSCYFSENCFIDTNYGAVFLPRLFMLPPHLATRAAVVYDALTERAALNHANFLQLLPVWLRRSSAVAAGDALQAAQTAVREFRLPCVSIRVRL
ncbi:uncharacterized protein V1518DRAFT_414990 [Limtongia smithiae]|uniref:uncharacterized protein n=1 Tax=Limtongia smithiae TaxID=1125753 RepID=UPI0034CEEF75